MESKFKGDVGKAYDRVESFFLEALMQQIGFNERWIGLVMVCVRTATYSILVDGEPKGLIFPLRGIRQGDPLSPFLCLLCIEGLHGLIGHGASLGDIIGFFVQTGPKTNSLVVCR